MGKPRPKARPPVAGIWLGLVLLGLLLSLAARAQAPATPGRAIAEKAKDASEKAKEAIDRKKDGPLADREIDAGAPDAAQDENGAAKADAADAPVHPFEKKPLGPLPKLDTNDGRGLRAVVIPIKGTIEPGIAAFIDRALASSEGAAVIIFDVDTFGGRVDAAVRIRDALLASRTPVVAFVHNRAISAGALISFAADHIVFANGASMGAATPIQLQGGQAEAVGEKMVSYMRAEMRATAEANGRSGLLAEAMVDADVAIEGVIAKGKLLTVDTKQAMEYGIGNAQLDSVEAILGEMGLSAATIDRPTENWAERLARFLTDPTVAGLLMSIGMLGLLLEFYTPGFGFAGGIGIACLVLFFAGHMVADLAGWEEVVLFVLGLAALGVEVFVIPGFGVVGVIGIGLIATSLIMALLGLPMSTSWEVGAFGDALGAVMLALVAAGVGAIIVIRFLPQTILGRWLVLRHTLGGSATGEAPAPDQPWQAAQSDRRRFLNARGAAVTDLHPVGKMRIGDDVLDVVSRDRWIAAGTPLKVVLTEGMRVVVIEDDDAV
ncbi:MAG: nodulation protein NfeD [Myxococcales bacterium]|nr:nodulation protein NfeD [Myxococcales bacterium]